MFWCGEGVRLLHRFVAVAAAAAGRRACVFLFFSRDSEGTLGSFVVPFGRLFGTKLGGVLVWRGGSSFAWFRGSGSSSSWSRRACVFLTFLEIQKGR